MTEQEFRDGLKKSVEHAGLSSERQMEVLAQMKGEKKTVRASNKIGIALVLGLLALLMTGGAVAGGRYLVDWHGEPLQMRQVQSDPRIMELKDWRAKGKWASIQKWNDEWAAYGGILASGMEVYAPTMDKLQDWVTADGTLPWPGNIPSTYQMYKGLVEYVCGQEGEIRLRSQETTEDGYIISYFDMPQEHRFVARYAIYLRDDEHHELQVQATLTHADGAYGLPMEDGGTFSELKVEGMQKAAAIEFAGVTYVALRQAVQPALTYKVVGGGLDGLVKEWLNEDDCLEIMIIGHSTPDELLAVFDLKAQ